MSGRLSGPVKVFGGDSGRSYRGTMSHAASLSSSVAVCHLVVEL